MADPYIDKFRKAVKSSKNNKEIDTILNKIYDQGFEDGCNEGNEE